MDLTSSWFLVLIIVLGGALSLLADRLGRTFGKKRLKLGNLRPRHTATIFTALTGMLVTTLTIVLVSGLSAEVREWIVKGRTAVKEYQGILDRYSAVNAAYEQALRKNNEVAGRSRELEAQLKRLERNLKTADVDLKRSQGDVTRAQHQAGQLKGQVGTLSRQYKISTANVAAQKQALSELRVQISKSQQTLATALRLRNEADEFSQKMEKELQRTERELNTTNTDLATAKKSLGSVQEDLKQAIEKYNEAVGRYSTELEAYNRQLEAAQTRIQQLSIFSDNSRDAPMIFSRGEELDRLEVLDDPTRSDAQALIRRLIGGSTSIARAHGAGTNDAGTSSGFAPYTRRDGSYITIDMQSLSAVNSVLANPGPKVLVAAAAFNAFAGEYVALDVLVFPNPIVFKEGELIGEARINGNGTEQEIFEALKDFLQTKVRQRALEKKMIVVGLGEPKIGEISPNEVLPLLNSIRSEGRQVRLQAFAKGDTRAAGPLFLTFKLR